ncbi:hypothetical protein SPRG_18938, partial [Saprolegnia parasitica CBS 223.65]
AWLDPTTSRKVLKQTRCHSCFALQSTASVADVARATYAQSVVAACTRMHAFGHSFGTPNRSSLWNRWVFKDVLSTEYTNCIGKDITYRNVTGKSCVDGHQGQVT